jgi:glycosyltransferase involved in cell wall biosynthesis
VLLAVGRLAPQKDYPTMLAAARLWNDLDPTPVLAIAGDGPLRGQMQASIDHDGLPVRLLGARDDVADLLAAADAVVLTSTWEARALVAQEALRAGVPLVATAVGGVPGLVGDAALLVPAGDPAALAAAVRRVLTEPGLAATLAGAGRVQSSAWPDETAVQEMLIKLYREWRAGAPPPIT